MRKSRSRVWRRQSGSEKISLRLCVICLSDQAAKARPIETRPGIGLARGGDVAVAGDIGDRVGRLQRARELCQHAVLRLGVGHVVRALQLYADGKIVAAAAPAPGGLSGVPGALR